MNELYETFTLVEGYDHKSMATYRMFTMDDIRAMLTSTQSEYLFIDKNKQVRRCRTNGKLKTWKKDPTRFERSFKYGLYESFRLDTQDMLSRLVVKV